MGTTVALEKLLSYLHTHLQVEAYTDYCKNGLQLQGSPTLSKVAGATSANLHTLTQAVKGGAQALIVHHGLFWKSPPLLELTGIMQKRIQCAFEGNLNILAYHLPLDGHLTCGNAASIATHLGISPSDLSPFPQKTPIGVEFNYPNTLQTLHHSLTRLSSFPVISTPLPTTFSPHPFKVVIATGSAASYLGLAGEWGAQVFITGEASERHYAEAQERGMHLMVMGHHTSESFGIQNLLHEIKVAFPSLSTEYLPEQNPL